LLTHFSLFSGIGGIDIASEMAGFTTVGQCEFADYPTKMLEKHWPDVPRWRDIVDVTADNFKERTGLHTADLISGGFPCQPFSVAGKQKGKRDDRYLWPEMLRVIRELAPRWVVAENVPGILRIAGDTVCQDLEREGYDVGIFNFEAAAAGAPHRRARIFFVANANQPRLQRRIGGGMQECTSELPARTGDSYVSDADSEFGKPSLERVRYGQLANGCGRDIESRLGGVVNGISFRVDDALGWMAEPEIPRVATGITNRVDRLKCLGNAVVPSQIYPILKAIAEIEGGI